MKIQFWGAAQTVTGSMHLIEANGKRILLDCGLFQGRRKDAFHVNRDFPFPVESIHAVVLSHAHIDHTGNLPTFVRAGFKGSIYATSATRDLCAVMLMDSAHIQESDVQYVNKRRAREHQPLFEPLYTKPDAIQAIRQIVSVSYEHEFEPAPGITVRYRDAGHMLGSAITILDIEEAGKKTRLVFSGDIGRKGTPIIRDPQTAEGANLVIMESTYGNRLHPPVTESQEAFLSEVEQVVHKEGKLIIPSFAVGRTQELLFRFDQLWESRKLPPVPVYVDSPLAIQATEVFRMHTQCFDAEMHDAIVRSADSDPLSFPRLHFVETAEESKRLNNIPGPMIIISASGMCESGRILHHLKNNVSDPKNTILFVGFQAQETLGRKLVDGAKKVSILGMEYQVRARVNKIEGYSAHADRNELLEWAKAVKSSGHVRDVFLVHGEGESQTALKAGLEQLGQWDVHIPRRGQEFKF